MVGRRVAGCVLLASRLAPAHLALRLVKQHVDRLQTHHGFVHAHSCLAGQRVRNHGARHLPPRRVNCAVARQRRPRRKSPAVPVHAGCEGHAATREVHVFILGTRRLAGGCCSRRLVATGSAGRDCQAPCRSRQAACSPSPQY